MNFVRGCWGQFVWNCRQLDSDKTVKCRVLLSGVGGETPHQVKLKSSRCTLIKRPCGRFFLIQPISVNDLRHLAEAEALSEGRKYEMSTENKYQGLHTNSTRSVYKGVQTLQVVSW
jgi:hypothetical protein